MIWLKENDNMVAYVPMLNKSYTEKEIREMSKFNCYEGWSELSQLVMKIQGIGYKYKDGRNYTQQCEGISKLNNVSTTFDFECFCLKTDERMKVYLKQIYEVFSNLTLYKVQEKSIEALLNSVSINRVYLSLNFVSKNTLDAIEKDIKTQIDLMIKTANNLNNLLKLLSDNGYTKLDNLFVKPHGDDDIWDEFVKERKTGKILVY